MKKVGILTINDNNNYGNRLQNYAVQEFLTRNNCEVTTLKNDVVMNHKNGLIKRMLRFVKRRIWVYGDQKRYRKFLEFNKNIKFSKDFVTIFTKQKDKYDYVVCGSDQVWNPTFSRLSNIDLLTFVKPEKRVSVSASFGIEKLPKEHEERTKKELIKFKAISVREDTGKNIVEKLTGRKDIEVLIDPTMLLNQEDWEKVEKKPKMLKTDRYILNYFLGKMSDEKKAEIERIAKENNCEIINILDKNSEFYRTGPSEFLYLERNAFLICTDSFHSCIFSILYNRPFIIFEREDHYEKMNSRLETLLSKFKLENRTFKDKITKENLNHDYTEAYKILGTEREKYKKFITKALDIK